MNKQIKQRNRMNEEQTSKRECKELKRKREEINTINC